MTKKKLIIGISSVAILSGLVIGGALANNGSATGSTPPDLTPQVTAQQSQLDNHEARITNTESDVKDLQENTSTPPSTNKTSVPATQSAPVIQPVSETPPTPEPVKAISSNPVMNADGNNYCNVTYSDNSQARKPITFKVIDYGSGHSGQYDNCSDYIGTLKN